MEIARFGVELSFNEVIYKQIDAMAMRSLLGQAFANSCWLQRNEALR